MSASTGACTFTGAQNSAITDASLRQLHRSPAPRCAGTSLEAAIFAQDHYSQHLTAAELHALVGPRAYDGAFRFAFVRDPFDRFLSAFYYLLFRGLTQSAAAVSPHDLLAADDAPPRPCLIERVVGHGQVINHLGGDAPSRLFWGGLY